MMRPRRATESGPMTDRREPKRDLPVIPQPVCRPMATFDSSMSLNRTLGNLRRKMPALLPCRFSFLFLPARLL